MEDCEKSANIGQENFDDLNAKIAIDSIDTHRERKGILQKKLELEYEGYERELQKDNLDRLKLGR